MQMRATGTCYMPVIRDGEEIQHRFEEDDVAEVPDDKVKQYRRSGNFVKATVTSDNPIYVEEPEEVVEAEEDSENADLDDEE